MDPNINFNGNEEIFTECVSIQFPTILSIIKSNFIVVPRWVCFRKCDLFMFMFLYAGRWSQRSTRPNLRLLDRVCIACPNDMMEGISLFFFVCHVEPEKAERIINAIKKI